MKRRQFLVAATLGAAALPLRTARSATASTDVIVLGAGLAGLNAALLLEQFGLRTRVLEASPRVGGRILTLDDVPGKPEAGGSQIGTAYARVLDAARRLGIEMRPSVRSPLLAEERMLYSINGRRRSRDEWARAADNPLPDSLRALPPDRALGRLLGANPLPSIGAWRDARHFALDVPARDVLAARGISEQALRLLEVNNSYGDTLAQTSLLNLHYVQANLIEALKIKGPPQNVAGGNQRLPEAMAKALRGDLLLGHRVVAIEASTGHVKVTTADGSRHGARFVVCALPLPAMRAIRFEPGLPPAHIEAVAKLAYARVTQLHVEVKRPFWEDQGLSPYVWSDGPLERIFPNDEQGTGRAGSLVAWINGAETAQWDALGDADAQARVEDELSRIFPTARGAVHLVRRVAWHGVPQAGGAWANWAPGQIAAYSGAVGRPHGLVHFAGEHTAHALRGMEGAMESGERAASEILTLL